MADKEINLDLNLKINNVKKTTEEIIDFKSSIIELNNGMKMPNLNKLSNTLKQVEENAKKAEKEIKDVSKAADKLGKSAKLGKLGLEALKDKLGALPVVGQTLSRSLDGVEGSFLSVAKAALPVAGIAGGLAAVGGAALLAYKNSEKLQESIGRLGTEVVDLGTNLPIFESIGDAVAVVTDNIADTIHNMNILNGTVLENTKKAYKDIMKYKDDEAKRLEQNLEYLKKIGASQEEITEAQNAYNKALVKSGIAVKDAIGDVYIKSTEAYNNAITEMQNKGFISLEALQSKIKETQSEQAEWIKKYGEGAGIDDGGYTLMLKNLTDLEKKVISTRDAVNTGIEVWRENNTIINQSAKAIEGLNTVEGVRSTDKNKRDELKEAREQLKALKEEQEILNDTVLDGAEAEEKRRSDLQAQLPLLEKYIF